MLNLHNIQSVKSVQIVCSLSRVLILGTVFIVTMYIVKTTKKEKKAQCKRGMEGKHGTQCV